MLGLARIASIRSFVTAGGVVQEDSWGTPMCQHTPRSFVRSFVYYYVQYDCVSVVSLLFTHTFIYALHRRRRKKENRTDLPRLVRL